MVKAERFCHIYTGVKDSCVTRVKGLSPLRGVGQSPAYPIDQGKLIKSEFLCFLFSHLFFQIFLFWEIKYPALLRDGKRNSRDGFSRGRDSTESPAMRVRA